MKIVYMGTPDFAVEALRALHGAGHEILCVVSQPDKPVGRHAELVPTPVKACALELGLPVLQPVKASDPEFIETIRGMEPDVIVVAAYGKILRKALLDIPKYGCVNIHGSLLPRWRGAAPIQWAVISGDRKAGLTTMMMAEGMDTGDMLLRAEVEISPEETGGSLFDRLKDLSGPLILETLQRLEEGTLVPEPQQEELATLAPMLTREMGELDFAKTAKELDCLIRGLTPWPGAYTKIGGKLLKIHRAVPVTREEAGSGTEAAAGSFTVHGKELFVLCGEGALKLEEVQAEGKKRMSAGDFLLGNRNLFEK